MKIPLLLLPVLLITSIGQAQGLNHASNKAAGHQREEITALVSWRKEPTKDHANDFASSIRTLANQRDPLFLLEVSQYLDFRYDPLMDIPVLGGKGYTVYPALSSLRSVGSLSLTPIISFLSSGDRGEIISGYALYSLTSIQRKTLEDKLGKPLLQPDLYILYPLLQHYSEEYEQKSVRLRSLIPEATDTKENSQTQITIPTHSIFSSNDAGRINHLLDIHHVLNGPSTAHTDAEVLSAIGDAQKLKAFELAPDLCDKLDPEPQPNVDGVMVAAPQGRLSPAIASASEAALRSMGRDALPALLDSISSLGHSPQFRQNAMPLIIAAAGDESLAGASLESAAKDSDKRAVRLKAILEKLRLRQ